MQVVKFFSFGFAVAFFLSGCGKSIQDLSELTDEKASKLSYEEFAMAVCQSIKEDNISAVRQYADNSFIQMLQSYKRKGKLEELQEEIDCSDVEIQVMVDNQQQEFNVAKFADTKFRISMKKEYGSYVIYR